MNWDSVPQIKDCNAIEQYSDVSEDITYVGSGKGTDVPEVTLTTLVPILIVERC
jgi:hypothetical protein